MFIKALLSYSLGKIIMYILNILVTHTQNTVQGKRIEPPAIFNGMKILISVSSHKGTFTDQLMNLK